MSKLKFIKEQSSALLSEKLKEGLSYYEIVQFFKGFEPKNNIEKRIIQRSVSILSGRIGIDKGYFKNDKLKNLLVILKK